MHQSFENTEFISRKKATTSATFMLVLPSYLQVYGDFLLFSFMVNGDFLPYVSGDFLPYGDFLP